MALALIPGGSDESALNTLYARLDGVPDPLTPEGGGIRETASGLGVEGVEGPWPDPATWGITPGDEARLIGGVQRTRKAR